MATAHELEIIRGDDYDDSFVVLNASDLPVENAEAFSIFFTAREMPTGGADGAIVMEMEMGDGIALADAAAAQYDVMLSADKTVLLTPGTYLYDYQCVEAGGRVTTVEVGRLVVTRDTSLRITV
jgi:hypothetical protein